MELLLAEVKEAPCFVISFDESFNEELKKEQMDFIVRYFKNGKVSMDGPNVNWKMLDLMVEDRNSNETYPKFLDVGSCGLHVVHGAFRTGMKQTGLGNRSGVKIITQPFP